MDNRSYREDFIKNNFEPGTDEYALISNFFKRVADCETRYGKTLEDGYTADDYIWLISALGTVALNTFRSAKARLRKYLEQLSKDGIISTDNVLALEKISYNMIEFDSALKSRFFKDFVDLQSELDMVLNAANKIDDAVFYPQFSALYLAWCGLTFQETLDLKRKDIRTNCINIDNRTIIPNATIMAYLNEYKNASVYYVQLNGQAAFWYKDSPWLMRTNKSEHVSRSSLLTMLNHLSVYDEITTHEWNDDIQGYKEKIVKRTRSMTFEKVYWSGIFYRAYVYEGQNGKLSGANKELLSTLFPESRGRRALDNFRLYQEYKNYFYPERK